MQLLIVAFGLANAAALLLWAARHHAGLDAVSDTTAMVSSDPWLPDAAACRPGSCPLVVLAVAADTGAWNTVKPVLLSALAGGEPVHVAVHFSGACARLVRAGKLAVPDSRMAVVLAPEGGPQHGSGRMEAELPDFVGAPHDITIVGASASAEGSASGAVVLCGSAASAAIGLVEDRYSTSLKTLDSFQRACPARSQRLEAARCEGSSDVCLLMAVADSIAQEQVLKHSGYQGALAITGSPQFDETIRRRSEGGSGQAAAQMWLARERAAVRVRLGVGGRDFVLLLAGQPVGDDEVLQLVVDGLKEAALLQRVWVLHRSHPRQSADELAAYRRVQEAAPAEWFQVATKTMEVGLTRGCLLPLALHLAQ